MGSPDFTAAILVFDDADLIDITGPREVLNAVRRTIPSVDVEDEIKALYVSQPRIKIDYIGYVNNDRGHIVTADGTKLGYDVFIDDFDIFSYDIVVLPGGKGIHDIKHDEKLHNILRKIASSQKYLVSVCTGAYGVAESGILTGREITTHQRHFDFFEEYYPDHKLIKNKRYITVDKIIIGGGVTSGFDATLHLIELMFSTNEAVAVATSINYTTENLGK